MIEVNCENKKLEMCLKEYRKRLDATGIHKELVSRKTYTKPSEKRRAQIVAAKYKNSHANKFI